MTNTTRRKYFNRELAWLTFNERVLMLTMDVSIPILERIRFLGIFSNNLDEFYRVRVASLLRAVKLSAKPIDQMDFQPEDTLNKIHTRMVKLQNTYEAVFASLIKQLKDENIHLIQEKQLLKEHRNFADEYFNEFVRPHIVPVILHKQLPLPPLSDQCLYLAVMLKRKDSPTQNQYALIQLPAHLPRFIQLPSVRNKQYVIFLDDLIRLYLNVLLNVPTNVECVAYALRFTRDAELDIDDDLSKSLVEKMTRSLHQRNQGDYVRINYDQQMHQEFLQMLMKKAKIKQPEYLLPGGRYHHRSDLMKFPHLGNDSLVYPKLQSIKHPQLEKHSSVFNAIAEKDILLHYPYHSFNYIVRLLIEAATDPDVRTIRICLYRVAYSSQVINALVNAVYNGKRVVAIVEVQARFDEAHNIAVTKVLIDAGVKVIPGVQGLKVHSKLIQISRKENNKTVRYVHIGSGNLNESTAKIYSDTSLLTANRDIGREIRKLFQFFESNFQRYIYRELIVSPFNTRRRWMELIQNEIDIQKNGGKGSIILKLNNLVDAGLINKLYEASGAGVKIQLIIRGVCSLIPGVKGMSDNISVVSILGRYLEHSRIFIFGNNGQPLYFISSADWMTRNVDHRIEVSVPIHDKSLQNELQHMVDVQLDKHTKVFILDKSMKNSYHTYTNNRIAYDAQMTYYNFLNE